MIVVNAQFVVASVANEHTFLDRSIKVFVYPPMRGGYDAPTTLSLDVENTIPAVHYFRLPNKAAGADLKLHLTHEPMPLTHDDP